jgi:outer membrane protein TolC
MQWIARTLALSLACLAIANGVRAQSALQPPTIPAAKPPVPWTPPALPGEPLPINLATALRLVNARSLDIAVASKRIALAQAQLNTAKVGWLPTITAGADYLRHDGNIQDIAGKVFTTSKTSLMGGLGVNAIFSPTDAIFGPLAARQNLRARIADQDAVENNTVLAVAEAYFNVQQARGELVGAQEAVKHAEELTRRTEKLAAGLVAPVEAVRARTELARRRQTASLSLERWRVASAELVRILRLDPTGLVDPLEPPHLRIALLDDQSIDSLIPVGLRNRPELASQQAVIEATLQRIKQEKLRPLIPSLVLRGNGANPPAAFSGGVFGGGNDALGKYAIRSDIELQVVWEFQNLLLGNRARVRERQAENQIALLEHFRLQDRIAAEIVQAHAQMRSAVSRFDDAESGLRDAADSVDKNFQGLSQTRRAGELIILMVRPQEVIAAIQTLAQAYNDYYSAIADHNRAQFRLYRALGQPAHFVTGHQSSCLLGPVTSETAPSRPD